MGHDLDDKNDSGDYVEKAINTALKLWIATLEWDYAKFDWYSYDSRAPNDTCIETMKRYLYAGCPIAWCLRWNQTTWNELTKGQLKTLIPAAQRTGWPGAAGSETAVRWRTWAGRKNPGTHRTGNPCQWAAGWQSVR
jgi:hypothetical protein